MHAHATGLIALVSIPLVTYEALTYPCWRACRAHKSL
jgi:hypothetical protein